MVLTQRQKRLRFIAEREGQWRLRATKRQANLDFAHNQLASRQPFLEKAREREKNIKYNYWNWLTEQKNGKKKYWRWIRLFSPATFFAWRNDVANAKKVRKNAEEAARKVTPAKIAAAQRRAREYRERHLRHSTAIREEQELMREEERQRREAEEEEE